MKILRSLTCSATILLAVSNSLFAAEAIVDGLPAGVTNTQRPQDTPPTPEQVVKMFTAPEGFRVTLFAGDPAVAQPISLTFDDRGRLWVAECYSYPQWNGPPRDRILIFEDADHDGRYDKRTIFKDGLNNLTSIQLGFGGVWAICSPSLLFFPDANADDKPDAEPTILLDGFDTKKVGHNIANGLTWGPDGWLYACHGILSESQLGPPGTPADQRVKINCGVWRYHPTRKVVEVVAHGTTNPWGLDFDNEGEAYFINCVIGHLWHLMPGAHYERMYGEHYRKHLYQLIDSCSDHLHWGGGHWTESRGGQGVHSEAGGGHAHCGLVIYNGWNFPAAYRGRALMGNLHGNRINCDRISQKGAGKNATHQPDFLTSTNEWFRPTALAVGPDGGLFIADWCDLGECHDNDGVHRTSGRIYKVRFGEPGREIAPVDWNKISQFELCDNALIDANDWFRRRALRALQERRARGEDMSIAAKRLRQSTGMLAVPIVALRAYWALWAIEELTTDEMLAGANSKNAAIAAWCVRLLGDRGAPDDATLEKLSQFAGQRMDQRMQLAYASLLQKLPVEKRFPLGRGLVAAERIDTDKCLPQMIWYGIEPAVAANPAAALDMLANCRSRKITAWTARRIISADPKQGLVAIVAALGKIESPDVQFDLLNGTLEALRGQRVITPPENWATTYAALQQSKQTDVQDRANALALVLGDGAAIAEHRKLVASKDAPAESRAVAIQRLVERREPEMTPLLLPLLDEETLRVAALRGLGAYDDASIAPRILDRYAKFAPAERAAALDTLAGRKDSALALLGAVEKQVVPATDISAYHVRQMLNLNDPKVTEQLNRVWGSVRPTSAERQALIAKFKEQLAPAALTAADSSRGRAIFTRTCGQCHKLFGEGGTLGPELTGSNRANLDYILENVLDPSAKIGRGYEMSIVELKDGRVLTGLAATRDENSIALQTATQTLVIALADIERRDTSKASMMPEGVWDKLDIGEVRDLVLYLQAKDQVAAPTASGK